MASPTATGDGSGSCARVGDATDSRKEGLNLSSRAEEHEKQVSDLSALVEQFRIASSYRTEAHEQQERSVRNGPTSWHLRISQALVVSISRPLRAMELGVAECTSTQVSEA